MQYLIDQFEAVKTATANGVSIKDTMAIKWYSQQLMADKIHSRLEYSSSILEVGCGGSLTLHFLDKLGHRTTGIDNNPTCLEYSNHLKRHLNSNVTLQHGEAFQLPFEDQEFEYVYSVGLVEHFTVTRQMEMLAEMKRVSKGLLHLEIPNPHPLSSFFTVSLETQEEHHLCSPSALFSDQNCSLIEIDGRCLFDQRSMLKRNPALYAYLCENAAKLIKENYTGQDVDALCDFERSLSRFERLVFGFQLYWIAEF